MVHPPVTRLIRQDIGTARRVIARLRLAENFHQNVARARRAGA